MSFLKSCIDVCTRALLHPGPFAYGLKIGKYYDKFINGHSNLAELCEYEKNKLLENAKLASYEIPYYRKSLLPFMDALDKDVFGTWKSLPLLSKETIKENHDEFINQTKGRYAFHFNTGGSTGEPLQLVASRYAGYVDYFHQYYCLKKLKININDRIVALDGTSIEDKEKNKNIYWKNKGFGDFPYGGMGFSSVYLNPKTADSYIDKLLELKPVVLRGYPSAIYYLASLWKDSNSKRLESLKIIQLTAEIITVSQKIFLEDFFNCRVVGQYGHSEMGVFAISNDSINDYMCSPYYGFVEVVDYDGRHVECGQEGEVVVTTFHNNFMPLIRYRTGDSAVFGGQKDGAVVLKHLKGRIQYDFLYDRNMSPINITGIVFVFGNHSKCFSNTHRLQIYQDTPGHIELRIQPKNSFTDADKSEIKHLFLHKTGLEVKINMVDSFTLTKRGKHKMIISKINAGK